MDYANKSWAGIKPRRMPESIKTALAVIALFAAYALVGTMEMDVIEAEAAEAATVCRVQS